MKILLTGADGFTGFHFMSAARGRGYEIVPLRSDLTDKERLKKEISERYFDAVVHLAAISFVGHKEEASFYNVNVVGTTNLLAALSHLKKKPHKVILASSANVYGNSESSPILEVQKPEPVNHYAMSKLAMECMARTYLDNLPIVVARPFNYTGSGQGLNFVIPKLVDHFKRRATRVELGNLHVEREFNDVRMVCDAYLALIECGHIGEVYNVCTGKTYTLQEVINSLSVMTGHSITVDVNQSFVRANEVLRLCGDPSKLEQVMSKANISTFKPTLSQTLKWMLTECTNQSHDVNTMIPSSKSTQ